MRLAKPITTLNPPNNIKPIAVYRTNRENPVSGKTCAAKTVGFFVGTGVLVGVFVGVRLTVTLSPRVEPVGVGIGVLVGVGIGVLVGVGVGVGNTPGVASKPNP